MHCCNETWSSYLPIHTDKILKCFNFIINWLSVSTNSKYTFSGLTEHSLPPFTGLTLFSLLGARAGSYLVLFLLLSTWSLARTLSDVCRTDWLQYLLNKTKYSVKQLNCTQKYKLIPHDRMLTWNISAFLNSVMSKNSSEAFYYLKITIK